MFSFFDLFKKETWKTVWDKCTLKNISDVGVSLTVMGGILFEVASDAGKAAAFCIFDSIGATLTMVADYRNLAAIRRELGREEDTSCLKQLIVGAVMPLGVGMTMITSWYLNLGTFSAAMLIGAGTVGVGYHFYKKYLSSKFKAELKELKEEQDGQQREILGKLNMQIAESGELREKIAGLEGQLQENQAKDKIIILKRELDDKEKGLHNLTVELFEANEMKKALQEKLNELRKDFEKEHRETERAKQETKVVKDEVRVLEETLTLIKEQLEQMRTKKSEIELELVALKQGQKGDELIERTKSNSI